MIINKDDVIQRIKEETGLNGDDIERIEMSHRGQWRFYHNFDHALEVAERAMEYPWWLNRKAAIIAALFHDIHYSVHCPINEFLSAGSLNSVLRDRLDPHVLLNAQKLIIATAHHFKIERGRDELPFLDCDIGYFAKDYDEFLHDNINIDKEFLGKKEITPEFAAKRLEFLRKILERDSIFLSNFWRSKNEKVARNNINSLIKSGRYECGQVI